MGVRLTPSGIDRLEMRSSGGRRRPLRAMDSAGGQSGKGASEVREAVPTPPSTKNAPHPQGQRRAVGRHVEQGPAANRNNGRTWQTRDAGTAGGLARLGEWRWDGRRIRATPAAVKERLPAHGFHRGPGK